MENTATQEIAQTERPVTTGVDLLHSMLARIAGLEARMLEVERCKHDTHNITIGDEALKQIAQYVMVHIAQILAPIAPEEKQEVPV